MGFTGRSKALSPDRACGPFAHTACGQEESKVKECQSVSKYVIFCIQVMDMICL